MGAFIISDISFISKGDRQKFEAKYPHLTKKVLVDLNSNSYGFGAWTINRDPRVDVIYFMGFMGYAEPKMLLKEATELNINIKFWSWIPINDRNAEWEKIKG